MQKDVFQYVRRGILKESYDNILQAHGVGGVVMRVVKEGQRHVTPYPRIGSFRIGNDDNIYFFETPDDAQVEDNISIVDYPLCRADVHSGAVERYNGEHWENAPWNFFANADDHEQYLELFGIGNP